MAAPVPGNTEDVEGIRKAAGSCLCAGLALGIPAASRRSLGAPWGECCVWGDVNGDPRSARCHQPPPHDVLLAPVPALGREQGFASAPASCLKQHQASFNAFLNTG